MNTLLIGYDLNRAGQDYAALHAKIKEQGAWWHHLDSTWIVRTTKSATEIRDTLKPFIDSNDELLVINITRSLAAWIGFNPQGSQWLKDNL